MRVQSHLEKHPFGFNMTPMIDVVFLLIIFFLVSMDLAKQENRMELDLSYADTGVMVEDELQRRITVNVLEDGTLRIAGRTVPIDSLEALLRQRVSEFGADVEVRIRASRRVPYGQANPVMMACVKAGIWDVKYAVYRREGGQP